MGDSMNVRALLRELTPQIESTMTPTEPPKNNRCGTCRKKLTLTDLACRCKARFCSAHRAPEEHACTHDFKADGIAHLKQQLERVVADKVERL